jgi:hypothetical protein
VPFAHVTDELFRYTLVAYDAAGRAEAVATGLFCRPTDWRNISPIRTDCPAIHLRAGSILFYADPERERREYILAAPLARDRVLATPPPQDACAVVLGCGQSGCPDLLTIDGGEAKRLTLRTAIIYWLRKYGRME